MTRKIVIHVITAFAVIVVCIILDSIIPDKAGKAHGGPNDWYGAASIILAILVILGNYFYQRHKKPPNHP